MIRAATGILLLLALLYYQRPIVAMVLPLLLLLLLLPLLLLPPDLMQRELALLRPAGVAATLGPLLSSSSCRGSDC